MHNVSVISMRAAQAALAGTVAFLLLGTLAGCSSDSSSTPPSVAPSTSTTPTASPTPTPTPTPTVKPYLPVPDGVTLTEPGTELEVGDPATVAFRPRKGQVGVLKLTVRKLARVNIDALADWQLDDVAEGSSLFFVTVAVKNRGEKDLGGLRVPLYAAAGNKTLVESTAFKTLFKPCPSGPLPPRFNPDDQVKTCLVYLLPNAGKLAGITFRHDLKFDPITWTGEVEQPKPKPKKPAGQ